MTKAQFGNGLLMGAGYLTAGSILLASLLGHEPLDPPATDIVTVAEDQETTIPETTPTQVPVVQPAFEKCPRTARACVDLTAKKSWLQRDGKVEYGPVDINSGRPGWETPVGTYHVLRHVKDEVSYEFNLEPMPWSTYFSPLGIAFHQGNLNEMSHGCIHLTQHDAEHYFHTLKVTDGVVVFA